MMRQEPALHSIIRARTSLPVADVVAHDFSHRSIDRDWLLMTALPGRPAQRRVGSLSTPDDRDASGS